MTTPPIDTDGDDSVVDVRFEDIDPELRPACQMRARLSDEAVSNYANALDDLPPVQLKYDAATGQHWLVDGCHTIHAARACGRQSIRSLVGTGSYLEAFAAAARANATHGVRVTNADKAHRVREALGNEVMKDWSSRQLAETCGVSHDFVCQVRSEKVSSDDTSSDAPERVVGKDGKSYPANRGGCLGSNPKDKGRKKDDAEGVSTGAGPVANGPPGRGPEADPGTEATAADPAPAPATDFDEEARWAEEEQYLRARYRAWPEDQRGTYVSKLVEFGTLLLHTNHPEIQFSTNGPLARKEVDR